MKRIKESKTLTILSILIIGVLFFLVTRLTYAYLAPVVSSPQTTDIGGSADLVDDFKFVFGDPLNFEFRFFTSKLYQFYNKFIKLQKIFQICY